MPQDPGKLEGPRQLPPSGELTVTATCCHLRKTVLSLLTITAAHASPAVRLSPKRCIFETCSIFYQARASFLADV